MAANSMITQTWRYDKEPHTLFRNTHTVPVDRMVGVVACMLNAHAMATMFARRHKLCPLEIVRPCLPKQVTIFRSPSELARLTWSPSRSYSGRVVARVELWGSGRLLLGRVDREDIETELGKWFFYPKGYSWGRNKKIDMKWLEVAERFANCVE